MNPRVKLNEKDEVVLIINQPDKVDKKMLKETYEVKTDNDQKPEARDIEKDKSDEYKRKHVFIKETGELTYKYEMVK